MGFGIREKTPDERLIDDENIRAVLRIGDSPGEKWDAQSLEILGRYEDIFRGGRAAGQFGRATFDFDTGRAVGTLQGENAGDGSGGDSGDCRSLLYKLLEKGGLLFVRRIETGRKRDARGEDAVGLEARRNGSKPMETLEQKHRASKKNQSGGQLGDDKETLRAQHQPTGTGSDARFFKSADEVGSKCGDCRSKAKEQPGEAGCGDGEQQGRKIQARQSKVRNVRGRKPHGECR